MLVLFSGSVPTPELPIHIWHASLCNLKFHAAECQCCIWQEVRLDTALPTKSYFPSWMRSRAPSNDAELGAPSALATPNLANTIHGSLHGGTAFADHQWATSGGAPKRRPNQAGFAPPSGLLVLGARAQSSPLEVSASACSYSLLIL